METGGNSLSSGPDGVKRKVCYFYDPEVGTFYISMGESQPSFGDAVCFMGHYNGSCSGVGLGSTYGVHDGDPRSRVEPKPDTDPELFHGKDTYTELAGGSIPTETEPSLSLTGCTHLRPAQVGSNIALINEFRDVLPDSSVSEGRFSLSHILLDRVSPIFPLNLMATFSFPPINCISTSGDSSMGQMVLNEHNSGDIISISVTSGQFGSKMTLDGVIASRGEDTMEEQKF